jgi:hypothetical protein
MIECMNALPSRNSNKAQAEGGKVLGPQISGYMKSGTVFAVYTEHDNDL